MVYTIGEAAKLLGVAASTLRYYDKEGLLPFIERSGGGMRVFKESDLETLKIIYCLKATGMQIKDIKEFMRLVSLGDESIDARLELFRKRRTETQKQIAELMKTLDIIEFKCWYYETAKMSGTTSVPDSVPDSELPENMQKIRAGLKNMIFD